MSPPPRRARCKNYLLGRQSYKFRQTDGLGGASFEKFPFRISTIRTDKEEFYQLLTYTGEVDLNMKLEEWQNFYNYHRPHSALSGKRPYEMLREKLNLNVAQARVE